MALPSMLLYEESSELQQHFHFVFFTKDVRPFMQPTIDGAPSAQIPTHVSMIFSIWTR